MKVYVRKLNNHFFLFSGSPENHDKNGVLEEFYTRRQAIRYAINNGYDLVILNRSKQSEQNDMKDGRYQISVILSDDQVRVSCWHSEYSASSITRGWIQVLEAIAFPAENNVTIVDKRESRQRDLTTPGTE